MKKILLLGAMFAACHVQACVLPDPELKLNAQDVLLDLELKINAEIEGFLTPCLIAELRKEKPKISVRDFVKISPISFGPGCKITQEPLVDLTRGLGSIQSFLTQNQRVVVTYWGDLQKLKKCDVQGNDLQCNLPNLHKYWKDFNPLVPYPAIKVQNGIEIQPGRQGLELEDLVKELSLQYKNFH
jgi:hypothetical protein